MPLPPIDLRDIALGTGGFVLRGQDGGDMAGSSLAAIGDINGDGFEDFAVGAPFAYAESLGLPDNGETFIVFGTATRPAGAIELSAIAAGTGGFVVRGAGTLDQSGNAVAGAGDLNGDDIADFVIAAAAADGTDNLRTASGEAYVVFGKATAFGAALNLSDIAAGTGGFAILGPTAGFALGSSATSIGDINGDGLADLLLGAPLADGLAGTLPDGGNAYVVLGRAGTDGTAIDLAALAPGQGFAIGAANASDRAGFSVGGAGDINGDGIADMVIGAIYGDTGTAVNAGRSFVVFGTAGTTDIDLAQIALGTGGFAIDGVLEADTAGRSVSASGDFNGDGLADILIGAAYAEGPAAARPNAGGAYLVFGTATPPASVALATLPAAAGYVFHGEETLDIAGFSVAFAGDLNADGYDDIAIAARNGAGASNLRPQSGDIYVVLGTPGTGGTIDLSAIAAGTGGFVIRGEDAYENTSIVSAAGDIDGDGYDDLLVGVPRGDGTGNIKPSAGDAYIVYGSDLTTAVTHAGDADPNDLTGDAGADTMVGGRGADILTGNGGADVMSGGEGNDLLRVADTAFRRIDGGTGTDTLALTGAGQLLDLADHAGSTLRDIERIDLTGTGANTLHAGIAQVAKLSGAANTLVVDADANDTVDLLGNAWTLAGTAGGFVTYTAGSVTLQVAEAATVLPCFVTGTHIATARGEVRVEALREGDIAVLPDGTRRPIRWIGHRATRIAAHPRPWDVNPVRVRADAFGPGRPYRDLRLSPDHAILAHGHLVPVRHLINGATIVQEQAGDITYWHVELAGADGAAAHDILLAEGLPCESYLDTGNRAAFANGGGATHLHPDFALRIWEAHACAPLLRGGPALADLRTELQAEATALGWQLTPDPDLRLLVDGRPFWPQIEDGAHIFRLPPAARAARLRSRTTAPAWLRHETDDTRHLGIAVTRLARDGIALPLDDARLASGWHPPEAGLRWTDGDAAIPLAGARMLAVHTAPLERYWRRPAARTVAKGAASV